MQTRCSASTGVLLGALLLLAPRMLLCACGSGSSSSPGRPGRQRERESACCSSRCRLLRTETVDLRLHCLCLGSAAFCSPDTNVAGGLQLKQIMQVLHDKVAMC